MARYTELEGTPYILWQKRGYESLPLRDIINIVPKLRIYYLLLS